jgi:PAS domain S-box-containing protein
MRAYDGAIRFTPDDARLLALFADQAAAALENARLHDAARRELAERARAEAALRASEGRYRMLLEQASDGIFVNDTEGRFLEVNARACAMLGYTREELLRLSATDTLDPADLATRPLVVPAPGADRIVFERRLRRKDGTTLPVEISVARLADGRVQAILRDISERRAAEEALRASEAGLATAQRIAHLGSWEYDLARDELCWSDEVYRIFGWEPVGAPVTDAAYWEAVHPDDRAEVARRYRDSLASGQGYDLEHRIIRSDGTIRVVQVRAELVRDANNTPTRRIGTVLDITERAQATERLRVQARVHELIAQGAALPRTLEVLTELIERELGAARCSILLLDRDGVTLRDCTGPRLPSAYRRAIDGVRAGPDVGSCGTAVHLRAPVVAADIATDPRWAAYRDLALAHGLRACWSLPILAADGRQVLGTFAVYHEAPHAPNAREQAVVAQYLALVAVAIERQRDEAALRAGEERLRAVVSSLPVLLFAYDREGIITLAEGRGLAALNSEPGPGWVSITARATATSPRRVRGSSGHWRARPSPGRSNMVGILRDAGHPRLRRGGRDRRGHRPADRCHRAAGRRGSAAARGGELRESVPRAGRGPRHHRRGGASSRPIRRPPPSSDTLRARCSTGARWCSPRRSSGSSPARISPPVMTVPTRARCCTEMGCRCRSRLWGARSAIRGRPARLTAIRDIRERHEAEAALRSREAMLAQSQRIAHLGSWEYDAATGTHSWSDEHYRIFGVDRAAFVPTRTSILALAHPDDRAAVERAMAWTLAGEADFDLEYRIVRPVARFARSTPSARSCGTQPGDRSGSSARPSISPSARTWRRSCSTRRSTTR